MARAIAVGRDGIRLPRQYDGPLDVRFAGHRVWSFTTVRDATATDDGLHVAWPASLVPHLKGRAEVEVASHNGGDTLFAGTVAFDRSTEPLVLADDLGHPLSVDKSGRLQRTGEDFTDASRRELVDAAHRVLVDLTEKCGLDAYLCYGGLLGAARTGHMIGHDSDLDLSYLSAHTHPLDIIRECRGAERLMASLGWQVVRMSAANFKIWVPLPSGKRAGVDVFGSFHIGEHFHLTGSLRGTLDRSAILPFGTIDLEGISFPAPADLDAFLAYTYGPSWKIPDPAFHFDHPPESIERMSQWFRGSRHRLKHWAEVYAPANSARLSREPSGFVRWAAARMAPGDPVLELGSGAASDLVWLNQNGHPTEGSDYCTPARHRGRERLAEAGVRTAYRVINLESASSVLRWGTRYAHADKPRHLYVRGVVEELTPIGRDGLWRFASMTGRRGTRMFVEYAESLGATVEREIDRHGGSILEQTRVRGGHRRIVVTWKAAS